MEYGHDWTQICHFKKFYNAILCYFINFEEIFFPAPWGNIVIEFSYSQVPQIIVTSSLALLFSNTSECHARINIEVLCNSGFWSFFYSDSLNRKKKGMCDIGPYIQGHSWPCLSSSQEREERDMEGEREAMLIYFKDRITLTHIPIFLKFIYMTGAFV